MLLGVTILVLASAISGRDVEPSQEPEEWGVFFDDHDRLDYPSGYEWRHRLIDPPPVEELWAFRGNGRWGEEPFDPENTTPVGHGLFEAQFCMMWTTGIRECVVYPPTPRTPKGRSCVAKCDWAKMLIVHEDCGDMDNCVNDLKGGPFCKKKPKSLHGEFIFPDGIRVRGRH